MDISKNLKIKLLVYALVSALGFSYMVLVENAGISIIIYTVVQLVFLFFIVPDRKKLLLLIPLIFMSLNSFLSASTIWRTSNLIISIILVSCMSAKFNFADDSLKQFSEYFSQIFSPLENFSTPLKWVLEAGGEKSAVIKRIVVAIIITIPIVIVIVTMLASADMVFSMKTEDFLSAIFDSISFNTIFKGITGIVAGLYLFGCAYSFYEEEDDFPTNKAEKQCDLVISNILLSAILIIYTLFVIIQFKYLFAGSALPSGLTYTEYARKGFFELLALTGINIAIIFTVTILTKRHIGKWALLSKTLCMYLCAVTVVLLISSFYRMLLYTNDDGLTRLRLFVLGFLIFELLGLISTFIYILKPKFNLILIYIIIALTYYCVLNVVPVDYIIARNQIDKYLCGERDDLHYIFTLSADAVPAMEHLYQNTDDETIKCEIEYFTESKISTDIPERWQRFNLSVERAENIYKKIAVK